MEEVELTNINPTYAHIRYRDGCESSVSLGDLAPCPPKATASNEPVKEVYRVTNNITSKTSDNFVDETNDNHIVDNGTVEVVNQDHDNSNVGESEPLRRSNRISRKPTKYGYEDD